MHRVAGRETGHHAAGPGDNASGFNAERHGRIPPQVPAAGTGDLAPVPHAAAVHLQQHLIRPQLAPDGSSRITGNLTAAVLDPVNKTLAESTWFASSA